MAKIARDLQKQWHKENRNQEPVFRPELVVDNTRKHKPNHTGSMYLHKITQTKLLRERISLAVMALKPWAPFFDAIAFSGMSGAMIGPSIALRMNKEMILVRKPKYSENRHSNYDIEGDCAAKAYIIVDDFIDTGHTRDYIKRKIRQEMPAAECLGVLQVNHLDSITLKDFERRGTPYPLAQ